MNQKWVSKSNSFSTDSVTQQAGPKFFLKDNRSAFAKQSKKTENKPVIQKKPNNTGLPDKLKSGIENLSGYSMDDVKVHYNSAKPAQLSAHAYAQGTDIHVASGQEKHLAHEAWHVVQQKQGRVKPTKQMKSKVNINDDVSLEKEADVMGEQALQQKSKIFNEKGSRKSAHVVQRRFIFSNKNKNAVPDERLDLMGAILREHEGLYVAFQKLRLAKQANSIQAFIYNQSGVTEEIRKTLLSILNGEWGAEDESDIDNSVEVIKDEHFDAPSTGSSWAPAWAKYFGEKKAELWSWLADGNRVKMQQTSGNIRATAKVSDYQAVRIGIGRIKLLHKLAGPSMSKTDERAKLVAAQVDLMLRRVVNRNMKKNSKQKLETLPDALFTFAFQKKLFGEANIKVAIDDQNNIISLDGVGRIAAMQKALASLGLDSGTYKIDVLAIHVSPKEYSDLHEIHSIYYDEKGKQRDQEVQTYNYGLLRTIAGPITKQYGKLTNPTTERDLKKFKAHDRSVFNRNNCLIHAITDAAGLPRPSDFQIIQIRQGINQPVGEMLYATNQAIAEIRRVLNITQTIDITYGNLVGTGFETETFAGVGGPLTISHDGYNHFYFDRNPQAKKKKSLGTRLTDHVDELGKKSPVMDVAVKELVSKFKADIASKIGANEKKVLNWLQKSLTAEEFKEVCMGGQIRINYSERLFNLLKSLKAEARKSSHYKGIIIPTSLSQVPDEHYGIDGNFFPTVLFGRVRDKDGNEYIYIQSERNSYNPSAKFLEKIHHVFDAAKYAAEKRNQGPYGESAHTDADPMGGTHNAAPGLRELLSPQRLQSIPLLLLHMVKNLPELIRKNWDTIMFILWLQLMNDLDQSMQKSRKY